MPCNAPLLKSLQPADILALAYLVPTSIFGFFSWSAFVSIISTRAVLIPLILYLRPYVLGMAPANSNSYALRYVLAVVASTLPWWVYPLGYFEMPAIIDALHPNFASDICVNDHTPQGIDEAIFGYQPSTQWHGTDPAFMHLLWMEYLQICYTALFALVVLIPAHSFIIKARQLTDRLLVGLLCAEYSCWLVYMIYPCAGPLWCLPPAPLAENMGFVFASLNLQAQDNSSQGTAFPSSHCAATVCLWVLCFYYNQRLALWLISVVPGLVLATVYLQYHYFIDALIGTLIGLACVPLSYYVQSSITDCFSLSGADFKCLSNGPFPDVIPSFNPDNPDADQTPLHTDKDYSNEKQNIGEEAEKRASYLSFDDQ